MLLAVGCSRPRAQPAAVDRLTDRVPGDFNRFAANTLRHVLDPSIDDHRFPIAGAEHGTRLLVSPGIDDPSPEGRVVFEIR
jgi:hypothetical protein